MTNKPNTPRKTHKPTPPVAGEIGVQASDGRRRLTLDPLCTRNLSIEAREVESTLPCGFRQKWLTGETDDGVAFDLSVGAGVGSRWLTFHYGKRAFCIDIEHVVRALIAFADHTANAE